jgi:hypothetical protein
LSGSLAEAPFSSKDRRRPSVGFPIDLDIRAVDFHFEIERSEIGCWWPLDRHLLRTRYCGAGAFGDFLLDFALDREQVT